VQVVLKFAQNKSYESIPRGKQKGSNSFILAGLDFENVAGVLTIGIGTRGGQLGELVQAQRAQSFTRIVVTDLTIHAESLLSASALTLFRRKPNLQPHCDDVVRGGARYVFHQ